MDHIDEQQRLAMEQGRAAVTALLNALADFHNAGVRTTEGLVIAYAATLLNAHVLRWQRWLPLHGWRQRRQLHQARHFVAHFDVVRQQRQLVYPDYVVEGRVERVQAQAELTRWLIHYRRIFHNRLLRRFHRHADEQRWAIFDLALARQEQQQQQQAAQLYTYAIQVMPHFGFYINRGNARYQDNPAAAISDYTEAIRLNPEDATAFYNRGLAHNDQGDFTAAISNYTEVIRLNSNDAVAFNNRGNVHKAQGDLIAAISDYNEAIRLNPDDATAFYNRGSTYHGQGDLTAASSDYQRALAKAAEFPEQKQRLYRAIGEVYRQQGEWQAALATYRQLMALADQRFWDWVAYAHVARQAGQSELAQSALATARSLVATDDAYAWACLESVARNGDAALAWLAKAATAPNFDPAHARQDLNLAQLWDDPRFVELLEKASTIQADQTSQTS